MRLRSTTTIVQLFLVITFPGFIRGHDCGLCATDSAHSIHRCEKVDASTDTSCCHDAEEVSIRRQANSESGENAEHEGATHSSDSEELDALCCHRGHHCGEREHDSPCCCDSPWTPYLAISAGNCCQEILLRVVPGESVDFLKATPGEAGCGNSDGAILSGREIRSRIASLLI